MANVLGNLLVGLLGFIGISGVGRLLIRRLGPLALHWYVALAVLTGTALSSVSVQCLAMAGSGRTGFRALGAAIVMLGILGHWIGRGRYSRLLLPGAGPFRAFAFSLLCLIVVLLTLISLAPSSKIDELHYHMLVGRRVLEDGGLRVYQLPFEQAIVPQMGYQLSETVFDATNTADARNILSLGFALVLWILIYGVATEQTGRSEIGLFAVLAAAAGLYPAVWYVSAGPHALGDLATFAGVAALLFPHGLGGPSRDDTRDKTASLTSVFACVLGAACAASTKISLLPLGAVITTSALLRLRGALRIQMGVMAVGLWLFVIGPLVIWTYIHTGSPFGAAFAELFGQTAYQPAVLQALAETRRNDQTGLGSALQYAVELLNGGSLALIFWGAVTSCRQWRRFAPLPILVVLQVVLIAIFLPHDFRFLGGLQYGLLVVGALALSPLWRSRVPFNWIAAASLLLVPWLAAELYYARPFVAVTIGATTREDFLRRHVAFTDDFLALNKILPRDAKLYVPYDHTPAVYAPRPVIFTIADWDRRTPLYRLLVEPAGDLLNTSELDHQSGISCGDVVYRNPNAIVRAYRSPNREPERNMVVVQRCLAGAEGLR